MHETDTQILDHIPAMGTTEQSRARSLPWPLTIFMISLVIPFFFQLGPVLMTTNRLVLTVMILPCLVMWMSGRAGPIRTADLALIGMCIWITVSFLVLHGPSVTVEAAGIRFIETMGAYLMARCYIRDADTFHAMVLMLFRIVALMLPFAIYEALTSHNILLEIANKVSFSGWDVWKEPRWGLDRVQGVFQHPILFGTFCGSVVALSYYVLGYRMSAWKRWFRTLLVIGTSALALSSGPLTALTAQIALITWDRLLAPVKNRWAILSSGVLSMVVAIELAANRSTPEIFISYFAFSPWTAYNRIRIWDYGALSVVNHPIFGIARNEWERPYWMSGSMDMFWLVSAVRHGLPAAFLLQLAFFSLFLLVVFKRDLSERVAEYRTGYLICMLGLYLGGWTVDYWKIIYVLFFFLLGSGVWILDANNTKREEEAVPKLDRDRTPTAFSRANAKPRYTHTRRRRS